LPAHAHLPPLIRQTFLAFHHPVPASPIGSFECSVDNTLACRLIPAADDCGYHRVLRAWRNREALEDANDVVAVPLCEFRLRRAEQMKIFREQCGWV